MSNQDNRSASQKIKDLENAVMSLYQTADNMVRDITTIKEAIKLLGNKVDSIVKASASGEPITDEVIGRIMVENNVEELRQRVIGMVTNGLLAAEEEVSENSFVVGTEQDDQGNTVNPRIQFALAALQPEIRDKVKGAKVGDVLNLQEGKLKFKVLESYKIQQPQAPEEAPEQAPEAPVSAEAPAAASEQIATLEPIVPAQA